MGKPRQSLTKLHAEQNLTMKTANLEPLQLENGALNIQRKRHVERRLEKHCPGAYDSPPPRQVTNHPCVEGWYYCPKHRVKAARCRKEVSFGCLSSILNGGPICVESEFDFVTETTPSGPIKIKYVTNCACF